MSLASELPPFSQDFAEIWRAADKIVYSKSLGDGSQRQDAIEREFDPRAVRQMKATAERDISVGGPPPAGDAIRAGFVDECHLLVAPIVVGGRS